MSETYKKNLPPAVVSPEEDEAFMREALAEAAIAAAKGEVPVGAVIVRDGKIIARAHNERETKKDASAHAELTAIRTACAALGGWRLTGCTLYVTLEPCPMCAGAIVNARVPRVVYGVKDAKAGAMGSLLDVRAYPLNHKPQTDAGVLEEDCREILRAFFEARRG